MHLDVDYQVVQQQILVAMRKRRSQAALSKQLGLSQNQVSRWEAGARRLKWTQFVRVSQACRLNLESALAQSIQFYGKPSDYGALVKALMPPKITNDDLKKLGVSRFQLSRWRRKAAEPDFIFIVALINHFAYRLTDFVTALIGPAGIPCLSEQMHRLLVTRKFSLQYPIISMIKIFTLANSYKVSREAPEKFFSRLFGYDAVKLKRILDEALALGVLEKKDGHLVDPDQNSHVDLNIGKDQLRDLQAFWMRFVADRVHTQPGKNAFRIACLSNKAYEQLSGLYFDFFKAVRKICAEDQGLKEHPVVMTLSLAELQRRRF